MSRRMETFEEILRDLCHTNKTIMRKLQPEASDVPFNPTTPHTPNIRRDWSLSLNSPTLRLSSNVHFISDLYQFLTRDIGQLRRDMRPENSIDSNFSEILSTERRQSRTITDTAMSRNYSQWKSTFKTSTYPLYNAWESSKNAPEQSEMDVTNLPQSILDQMMDHFINCFLCLPLPDVDSLLTQYKQKTLCPLLQNAIFAWSARHASIYHGMFQGKNPNIVGEQFFATAKNLLRTRFLEPTLDTMHALLVLYIYAIGKSGKSRSKTVSEAYMYLGLAIRMGLDMGLHKINDEDDEIVAEKKLRLFTGSRFLESLCSAHAEKPFLFPYEYTITAGNPNLMSHETGDQRYRVEFMMHRQQINKIHHEIAATIAVEEPTVASILILDQRLKEWYRQLPLYLQYRPNDRHSDKWVTASFREQACVKLGFEYNFQICQLYSTLFSRSGKQYSHFNLSALEKCIFSCDIITELLDCWVKLQQPWCHFTIETILMATLIYGRVLASSDDRAANHARKQLRTFQSVLGSAPVRHHMHVKRLVKQIADLLDQGTSPKLNIGSDDKDMALSPNALASQAGTTHTANSDSYGIPIGDQVEDLHPFELPVMSGGHADEPSDLNGNGWYKFTDFLYTPSMIIPDPVLE
ncbi:hypothetical protein INT44_000935 [Umbelopsis vinacea]|uniref:Xylanolytic transcriptional activator regulatory domain-containing protein n=1 Tax=Umbelopsis vinacea TaxID=44442 RepID=A0A8H7UQC8_9FUNG|nr:hypothetical protein INT44_000935 [Umbelopsis vinacea]